MFNFINSNSFSFHGLVLFSIQLYLVITIVFETMQTEISILSSLSLYVCVFLCLVNIFRDYKLQFDWLLKTLFLFLSILFLSYFWSPTSEIIKSTYLYRTITSYILIALFFNTINSEDDIFSIVSALVLGGALLAINIYREFGVSNLMYMGHRIGSDMGNQNLLGLYCACSIILSFFQLVIRRSNSKVLYISLILICIPVVMFTGSRKSVIIILTAIGAMYFFNSKNENFIRNFITGCAVLFGFVLAIEHIEAFSAINDRFVQLFNIFSQGSELKGDMNRIYFVQRGLDYFFEAPFLGNGFCYSYYVFGAYTHNNYIEILLNNGIIGFLLYYYIYFRLLYDSFKYKKGKKELYILSMLLLLIIVVGDFGVVSYYNRFNLILILLIAKVNYIQKSISFCNR